MRKSREREVRLAMERVELERVRQKFDEEVRPELGPGRDQSLTSVMARLGQEDLETVDTLVAGGIVSSRADAVRWALARIRERPAYEQLRARAREIEALKSQF